MTALTLPAAAASTSGPAYKRVSLIKDRVGVSRAPSFPLPPSNHVYGMKCAKDPETAGTGKASFRAEEERPTRGRAWPSHSFTSCCT